MKIEEYREFIQMQGMSDDAIEERMVIIRDFLEFLTHLDLKVNTTLAGKDEVDRFARKLIIEGRNTLENFSFLRDYADWLGDRCLYVALIEVMDCYNAMEVLSYEIEKRHGREMRVQIFSETLPPLGANEEERCIFTRTIMRKMEQQITPEEMRHAWFQVQHGIPVEDWRKRDLAEKEIYQKCGNIDEYLNLKRQKRDTLLTRLRDENKLWYTVVINDEVLEYVKSDPEMEVGCREGNKIYISKIPYNAVCYLHETDPKMKRYYACHCPLLREAIRNDQPISSNACNCSLGHASHYLAGLDQEIRGEVLESVIKGDTRCRFVFYLPG